MDPSTLRTSSAPADLVRARHGSVLSRGLVLKTDQRGRITPRESLSDPQLQGAPLFRGAHCGLGVYGVAQPTVLGLKTVLTLLGCAPGGERKCVWVCTREEPVVYVGDRPFVLRDAHAPTHTFSLSDRAASLEAIEQRLKNDILDEAAEFQGLVLVHEEQSTDEGVKLVPTWVAVQRGDIRTVREVWTSVESEGFRVRYHRLPIARDQPLEHNYLDAYTQVIKETDPQQTAFVANCGAGVFRTTFAMIAAVIVRRRQLMLATGRDPLEPDQAVPAIDAPVALARDHMQRAHENTVQAQGVLRLLLVLNECLSTANTQGAIASLLARPELMDTLRHANSGDYGVIRQLCGLLDNGLERKVVVDKAIDACDQVVNLRESVLSERLRYALGGPKADDHLKRAVKALEVYYFLVAFTSYVDASRTGIFKHRFADWLRDHAEIWHGIVGIRSMRRHLYLFDPVVSVGPLVGQDADDSAEQASDKGVTGDAFANFVVRNRTGTVLRNGLLLKSDIWLEFLRRSKGIPVKGTVNFRRVPGTNIYGTGQPTVQGIQSILDTVVKDLPAPPSAQRVITWINLREEPVVYIKGRPYCLRENGYELRNIRDYSGIQVARLEQLEDRLLSDVSSEIEQGDGKLLLHTEAEDGSVLPVWEDVHNGDVATVQDVMVQISRHIPASVQLRFLRIPLTAEKNADYSDISELLSAVVHAYRESMAIVVNCQLGRGRTTLVAVHIVIALAWLRSGTIDAVGTDCDTNFGADDMHNSSQPQRPLSYHVINSLLRVIPRGLEVKRAVDAAIDQCGGITNLRDAIENARTAAENLTGEAREHMVHRGIYALRRYFYLILFAAFIDASSPDTVLQHTFEAFVRKQPVIDTIARELDRADITTITPLRKVELKDGKALSDEVQDVVQNRHGSILSAYTMLKSDFFSGILKANLPLRIDGIPNLRVVVPLVHLDESYGDSDSTPTAQETWGSGMPTVEGLRHGLARMGAYGPNATPVVWTNLREEPVLYVNGRPHVLRLADQPLNNVEATGVTTDVVERMEVALKRDLLEEAHAQNGRVLLHDEIMSDDGKFVIIPVWETVSDADILTPRDVYERVQSEGYRVDYARVAITDEQAPVPTVFSQLEDRVNHAIDMGAITAFNCQMGRGRTTSGMVIASLIMSINSDGPHLLRVGIRRLSEAANAHATSRGMRADDFHLRGEYRCILQLVGVLAHGKLAKILTDAAIDRMETIQNLRNAISLARLRADAAGDAETQKHLLTVFRNYLVRYGYLIAFASYLLDRMAAGMRGHGHSLSGSEHGLERSFSGTSDTDQPSMPSSPARTPRAFPSFPVWLQTRREIGAILERADID
ncbi:hypothetical protein MCUN1_003679 [Malassezia cuniculi]|uniref:Paladin n=1 Tax=Malassezia cuniculi TaxID=948313 RepID=A0AAF0EU10_9BASI|nr:hypothetical protein MCUN1_003679 [Malassezia cuniculi]